ncbi:arginine N-succinyltransferase, partial [Klebsiella pneumoniae]|uniref:arginine N-succinyltransferase n=1 Tax=Klebsiella pneumoniae TaxID=573 RepID=UPI002114B2B1
MLFRPVRENDLDDIVRLAARAGVGMTSLPHDVGRLAARIRRSIETFAGAVSSSTNRKPCWLRGSSPAKVSIL